ncbi:hypothetical protein [Rathayibacter tritici]|uniref:HTH araC/xylS-type domain-containing protein n=1 Tax=Rathayibacter tritici TaxID=33888 RepID=A0A160KQ81_9MICO|nr:hypothetical protein [Rathayibacter tritici]AND15483.1 hypothetical protein A6122_0323 [Rathayibacter tritici]PPI46145.1 hypothetical protein C5D18_05290 [Rathayibacter tritici]
MASGSSRRTFSLLGEDSRAWLAERDLFGQLDSAFRLVSDEILFDGFRMARMRHTEGAYVIARRSSAALLLVQIEGECTLRSPVWGALPRILGPGDVAVLPGGTAPFHLSAERPVARYQIDFDLAGLPAQARVELEPGVVFSRPAKGYRDAVASTANIAFNSSLTQGEAGFADFALGLRHLSTALLLHALEATAPDLPEDADSLHRAALRVISARATDPDFTVESLAHAVGASSRTLREVFAHTGSSAKAALTGERVRRARVHAAVGEDGGRFTTAEIARLSGFRDARALRRALAKVNGER